MNQQATPAEILSRAKKNKYTYNVSSQAFTVEGREFVLYNLSLKKDYAEHYDFVNYRRGLTYMEEIVDFQHGQLTVARKGLRKFKDLMAEYLDLKESHVNSSKYHLVQKNRLFKELENSNSSSFLIYNTEKVNGQNAQISVVCGKYWLIGSKNKCLLVQNEQDLQNLKNKHQYRQTSLIAQCWFKLLKGKSEEHIAGIKLELSGKNLVGEYCNMENMQHLVNYGQQAQLFFYALVDKNDPKEDCLPISATYKFLETFGLPKVNAQIVQTKTFEHTIQKLREIVVKMNETTMKDGGEGSVIYISGVDNTGEHNYVICKVKTIQYRIYRKLRQKLKIYLQKYNKSFDNLMKKFTKEIAEIARQFNLKRPLDDYIELGKRAFILCEDQNRPISKFISNRFIEFLRLLEKNISKQKFMEIVNSNQKFLQQPEEQQKEAKEEAELEKEDQKEQEVMKQEESRLKKVIVLVPLTIPASGKTSILEIIKTQEPGFKIWSISSDEARKVIMDDIRKKSKNLSKKQAFQKSSDRANKLFYSQMAEVFKNISLSKEERHVFFIDKNHPQSAIKPTVKNVEEKIAPFHNLKVIKICLIPAFQCRLAEKGLYSYPFSAAYVLSCLKRVINRPEHLTLEGSEEERCNVVIGFANLFRNFSLSHFNLQKYFHQKIPVILNNQKCIDFQKESKVVDLFKQVLLRGKPGKFDEINPKLQSLTELLKNVELNESAKQVSAKDALQKLELLFDNFENISWEKEKEEKKE